MKFVKLDFYLGNLKLFNCDLGNMKFFKIFIQEIWKIKFLFTNFSNLDFYLGNLYFDSSNLQKIKFVFRNFEFEFKNIKDLEKSDIRLRVTFNK